MMSKNNHNYYFQIYFIDEDKVIHNIHIIDSYAFLNKLKNKYKNAEDNCIYAINIKNDLIEFAPDIIENIRNLINDNDSYDYYYDFFDSNIGVRLLSEYEYRSINEVFDNNMKFIESIVKENEIETKHIKITKEILLQNGFELNSFCGDMYEIYKKIVFEENSTKPYVIIDFIEDLTNNGAKWEVHLDNNRCETIGAVQIDTIWQFNMLMRLYDIKFQLNIIN